MGKVQHESEMREQETIKRHELLEELTKSIMDVSEKNEGTQEKPEKRRDNENELKFIFFRKIDSEESMSTQIKVLLNQVE